MEEFHGSRVSEAWHLLVPHVACVARQRRRRPAARKRVRFFARARISSASSSASSFARQIHAPIAFAGRPQLGATAIGVRQLGGKKLVD